MVRQGRSFATFTSFRPASRFVGFSTYRFEACCIHVIIGVTTAVGAHLCEVDSTVYFYVGFILRELEKNSLNKEDVDHVRHGDEFQGGPHWEVGAVL